MANFILQELPEGMANRTGMPFPKMQTYTMFSYEQVVKHIHAHSPAFSEATIRGVLDTLASTLCDILPEGHSVKIDGLGVFSLSLGFSGQADPSDKESYRHVQVKDVNFKVDHELLHGINRQATFERTSADVRRQQRPSTTAQERLALALDYIAKHGQMNFSDYVRLTGLSRSAASRELKRFTDDAASGLTTRGVHTYKVWVSSSAKEQ